MMVVLLILSIVLAAMAPVMTTRIKRDTAGGLNGANSIWQWSQNNNGVAAYFGAEANQTAMIGQTDIVEGENPDPSARLIINTSDTRPNHILFKNGNDVLGRLTFQNNSLVLGTGSVEGPYNTAIGVGALSSNTTGEHNTASGYQALYSNTTGYDNTAVGYNALYNNSTSLLSHYGTCNTAIGSESLYSNTTGFNNTASGHKALYSNTEGLENVANGYQALYSNTGGSANIAIGSQALYSNTTGGSNIAIGDALGKNTTGAFNIAIGGAMWENTTGRENIAMGLRALSYNTTGGSNIAIGKDSLWHNETGYFNTSIGYYACSNVLGSNKTCIGVNSGPIMGSRLASSENDDKVIFLGDEHTTVLIAGKLSVGSDTYLGVSGNSYHVGLDKDSGNFVATDSFTDVLSSDRRLKYVGKEFTSGLDKIRQLKVFNYTFKKDEKKTPHVGVIAQDLQKIFPNAVKKGADGFLTIRMEDMFYALVNAVKELDAKVTAMAADFAKQKEQIKTLTKENKELKAQNKRLEARLNALEAKIK